MQLMTTIFILDPDPTVGKSASNENLREAIEFISSEVLFKPDTFISMPLLLVAEKAPKCRKQMAERQLEYISMYLNKTASGCSGAVVRLVAANDIDYKAIQNAMLA